jgi:hypothetical protein
LISHPLVALVQGGLELEREKGLTLKKEKRGKKKKKSVSNTHVLQMFLGFQLLNQLLIHRSIKIISIKGGWWDTVKKLSLNFKEKFKVFFPGYEKKKLVVRTLT